jgi:hypothetical protein
MHIVFAGAEGSRSHKPFVRQVEERGETYSEGNYLASSNEQMKLWLIPIVSLI